MSTIDPEMPSPSGLDAGEIIAACLERIRDAIQYRIIRAFNLHVMSLINMLPGVDDETLKNIGPDLISLFSEHGEKLDFMDSGKKEGILRNDFQRLSDKIFGKDASAISEEAHNNKIRKAIFNNSDLMQITSNIPEKGLDINQIAKMPLTDKKNLQGNVDYLLRIGILSAKEIAFGAQHTLYILTAKGEELASEIKKEQKKVLKKH